MVFSPACQASLGKVAENAEKAGASRSTARGSSEARSHELTRSRGERGGSEGAEGCFRFYGAAETSRRGQGSLELVVCSRRVGVRGVEPASPGRLRGGMIPDSAGRNHNDHERGSGRGTLGLTKKEARPGNDSALSAPPCEPMTPRLRVTRSRGGRREPEPGSASAFPDPPRDPRPARLQRRAGGVARE